MARAVTRVVLDTNILVSSFWGGLPGKVIQAWLDNRYPLLVSPAILSEYQRILTRLLPESLFAQQLLHSIYLEGISVQPAKTLNIIRDLSDNRFLECALAGHADCIVSGDRHLLDLKSFRRIPILTARTFLEKLG